MVKQISTEAILVKVQTVKAIEEEVDFEWHSTVSEQRDPSPGDNTQ
jgi:hypothetical protein